MDRSTWVKVAEGFEVTLTDVGPCLSDGSGNAYFVSTDKSSSLREKAIAELLMRLYKEALT